MQNSTIHPFEVVHRADLFSGRDRVVALREGGCERAVRRDIRPEERARRRPRRQLRHLRKPDFLPDFSNPL